MSNMMWDVMPTISEDSISQRSSQFGDDANFEQLMVSMLDERDKLVDSLKNEQEKTGDLEVKVKELEKERDSLNRQLNQNLPQEFASLTKVCFKGKPMNKFLIIENNIQEKSQQLRDFLNRRFP